MMTRLEVPKGWDLVDMVSELHIIPDWEDGHEEVRECACQPKLDNPRPESTKERSLWVHRTREECLQ